MIELYDQVTQQASVMVTKSYSTSFSLGIKTLGKAIRQPIYNIYGFVRFADEIVDTFHIKEKRQLLDEFKQQTLQAIEYKVSTNPIIHAFQLTVNQYNIPWVLIDTFFNSMYMDLNDQEYDEKLYNTYIDGSAEVVGLMCLCVFLDGNQDRYKELEPSARRLGAVFQKVNFLRDLQHDYKVLNRTYFPGLSFENMNDDDLQIIFNDIESDFDAALTGIKQLPNNSQLGVYLAYRYYRKLFNKIKRSSMSRLKTERIRIPNSQKYSILLRSFVRHQIQYH